MIETKKMQYRMALDNLQKSENKLFNLTARLNDLQIRDGKEFCSLSFSSSPCKGTGSPCDNSKNTCKDTANFSVLEGNFQSEKTYIEGAIEKALESLALGETGAEKRLRDAKNLFQKSHAELADSELMIGVLTRLITKAHKEISALHGAVEKARRGIFQALYDQHKKKIVEAVGDSITEAYAFRQLSGVPCSIAGLATDIFRQPHLTEISEMQENLTEKYLAGAELAKV